MFQESIARLGLDPPAYVNAAVVGAADDFEFETFLRAVIARESAWNPGALRYEPRLNDASYGLMQVLLSTARGIRPGTTPSELFDPAVNVPVGAAFLRDLFRRYGRTGDAVSAYNAGHPISGNRAYVDDVLAYQVWYANHLPATRVPGDEPAGDEPVLDSVLVEADAYAAGLGIAVLLLLAAGLSR